MDLYGIRGPINNWLNMFLTHRKMKAVVEAEQSEEVTVDSGVPQGTVLGTVILLLSHKWPPRCSKVFSKTDCRRLSTLQNHQLLQEDLKSLEAWAKWLGHEIQFKKMLYSEHNQRLPGACNRSPGSKLLSLTTQLHCGGHLGGRAQLPDTILQEDHPMTIPSMFGFNWATGSRQDGFYVNFP